MTKREKEILIAGYNAGLKDASTQAQVDADGLWRHKGSAEYYLDLLAKSLLKNFASLEVLPCCTHPWCKLALGHEFDDLEHEFFEGRNDQEKETKT